MSEENEKMELSEAALEGVSGGYSDVDHALASLCSDCNHGIDMGYHRCTGSLQELRQYLQEHGVDSVKHHYFCPFRAKA